MQKTLLVALFGIAALLNAAGSATAQVAGMPTIGVVFANAEQDIAKAKSKMVDVEKKAVKTTGGAKTKMDQDIAAVKRDMQSAEDKLVQMNKAGVKHWKEFEADVIAATARLRKWVETAIS